MKKYGYDGMLRGRPVEVRSCRKDDRYRIQRNVHNDLLKKKGSYIFCATGRNSKVVTASRGSSMLKRGKWFKDRTYSHKFLKKEQVF